MDFQFSPEQERFREEVRQFLEAEISAGGFEPKPDAWICGYSPEFSRKMARRGWIGITWPRKYGGQERTYVDRLVLTEELLRYGAPVAAHWFADRQIALFVLQGGSEQLKQEIVPKMASAEVFAGAALSEPDSGSDLPSLKTKAREEGDYFVVDGHKIWVTGAHNFTYVLLLARTDPDSTRHRGLSLFLVDPGLPGITVRPLIDLTGTHHFNEIFFDNVKVPRKYLIGEKNRGWFLQADHLDYERAGMERVMSNYPVFKGILDYAKETKRNGKPMSKDPLVRNRLAELSIEFEVGRLLVYRVASILDRGKVPDYEAAMAKTYGNEFQIRLADAVMSILGPYGALLSGSKWAPLSGIAATAYLFSPACALQGGTTEILRNTVAFRGLGLPRD